MLTPAAAGGAQAKALQGRAECKHQGSPSPNRLQARKTIEEYRRSLDLAGLEIDELRSRNQALQRKINQVECNGGYVAPTPRPELSYMRAYQDEDVDEELRDEVKQLQFEKQQLELAKQQVEEEKQWMEQEKQRLAGELHLVRDENSKLTSELDQEREARWMALHTRVNARKRREAAVTIQQAYRSYAASRAPLAIIPESAIPSQADIEASLQPAASPSTGAAPVRRMPYVPPLALDGPQEGSFKMDAAVGGPPDEQGEEGEGEEGEDPAPLPTEAGGRDAEAVERLLEAKDTEIRRLQNELSRMRVAVADNPKEGAMDGQTILSDRGRELVKMSLDQLQECLDEILRGYCTPKRQLEDIRMAQHKVDTLHSGHSFRSGHSFSRPPSMSNMAHPGGRRLSFRISSDALPARWSGLHSAPSGEAHQVNTGGS